MKLFDQGRALVIGVGEYADSRWNELIATRDATEIGKTLINPDLCAYPPGQVQVLADEKATRQAILEALDNLAATAQPEDTVLISFTGHGALGTDSLYYLGSYDMRFDGQQITSGTAVSMADLGRKLQAIEAERVVLVLNACFAGSGATMLTKGGIGAERIGTVIDEKASRKLVSDASGTERSGRAIITASAADQLSHFLRDGSHSYFTNAFLSALRGGNGSSATSGLISLFDLYSFVHLETNRLVKATLNQEQVPLLTLLKGAGNFALAHYPRAAAIRPDAIPSNLPPGIRVDVVEPITVTAFGDRASAVNAGAGSTVTIDNRQEAPLINFGNNNSVGDIRVGDLVRGNLTKYADGTRSSDDEETVVDPAKLLPRLSHEIGTARHVDEDVRDEAVSKIDLAVKSFGRGNRERTRTLVIEALELLAPLRGNAYLNSKARKLEQVRDSLG
ncbi:MAG: caspase family protein [Oscillochloris sp.]|nr:caspase family protein [Oscillochloris sp.]